MRVLLRADAGSSVGLGHIRRCLALAQALTLQGADSRLVVRDDPFVRSLAEQANIPASPAEERAGSSADLRFLLETARSSGTHVVVVDSYGCGPEYVGALQEAGLVVVFVDDLARHEVHGDIVVNPNPAAATMGYGASAGNTCFLLGPSYALLNPAYAEPRPKNSGTAGTVLVTLGGTDERGLMPNVVSEVLSTTAKSVTAVIGPYFPSTSSLSRMIDEFGGRLTAVINPASLLPLLENCIVAVTAAGQTLFEVSASGTAGVAFQTAENQAANLRAFTEAAAIRPTDIPTGAQNPTALQGLVQDLLNNPSARQALSAAGRRLVDGRGAERVARKILEYLE